VQTPPGLFWPATHSSFQFRFIYASLDSLWEKNPSCPLCISVLQHRTSPYIDSGVKSLFTNSIRFLSSFVEHTNASRPRTFALFSICSSVSGPYFAISSGIRRQCPISTRRSRDGKLVGCMDLRDTRKGIVTKRRAHPLYVLVVGAGVVPFFFRNPSPCSVCYYGPLTVVLLLGAELFEKIRERPLPTTVQPHTQTSPPGIWIHFHSST